MGYANWIMVKHDTPDKPEIWEAARQLGIDPDAVLGKMIRAWIWFDTQTEDGYASSVTKLLLDREVGVTGFCDSMIEAGWMVEEKGTLFLPNFDRHNGKTAKKRGQSRERMRKKRAKSKDDGYAKSVTSGVTKALLEEEEEEKIKKDSSTKSPKKKTVAKKKPKVFIPPDLSEVAAYCAERGKGVDPELWHDFYSGKGWMVGKTKMVDWKAAVRTWEKGNGRNNSGAGQGQARQSAAERNTALHDYMREEGRKALEDLEGSPEGILDRDI